MTLHAMIPIPGDLHARYNRDSAGRDWLASLPGLIREALDRWQLSVDLAPGEEPWNGHGALVVPVLQHGRQAALKIAYPHEEALVERHATALWGGRGLSGSRLPTPPVVPCCWNALTRPVGSVDAPMDEARQVWGEIMRELSIAPDDRPEWRGFDHIAATAERWSDEMPSEWERQDRPFPRWLLEAALEVCQTRGAVGRRSGRDVPCIPISTS